MNARRGVAIRLRDERGISAIIVVVSLIGILGAAVLSLDFGSAWTSRRTIITATDATALHEAMLAVLAANPSTCSAAWTNYLSKNANDLVTDNSTSPPVPQCLLVPDAAHPGTGYVRVDARKYAISPFGGIFGVNRTQPYSMSAAEYGFSPTPVGLRPMAFCLDNPHVLQWVWYQNWLKVRGGGTADPNFGQLDKTTYDSLKGTSVINIDAGHPPVKGVNYHYPYQSGDSVLFIPPPGTTTPEPRVDYPVGDAANGLTGTSYASFGVVHRMFFTKDDVYESGNCGGSTGNWGWIDFNGGSNSSSDQNDWTENGYDGAVGANNCNADTTYGDRCPGDTGSSGGAGQQELQSLVDSQAVFYIPIFDDVCCGSGSTAQFRIWGFLPLVLRGFKDTGSQDTRYFDFEFKDAIAQTVGPIAKTCGLGCVKTTVICEVDHDGNVTDAQIATRCGQ